MKGADPVMLNNVRISRNSEGSLTLDVAENGFNIRFTGERGESIESLMEKAKYYIFANFVAPKN